MIVRFGLSFDAGVKEVLLPADQLKEAEGLRSYMLDGIRLTPVSTIDKVLALRCRFHQDSSGR
jgi:hypothetical protein